MYIYITSYVRENYNWKEKLISDELLGNVLNTYQSVRLVCRLPDSNIEFEVHFNDIKPVLSVSDKTLTVGNWLSNFEFDVLQKRDRLSLLTEAKNVKLTDLHKYELLVSRGSHKAQPGGEIPIGTDVDIKLDNDLPAHNEMSVSNLGSNAVVVCNGRLLKTVYVNGSLFGVNAATECSIDKGTVMSMLDFTDVGGCTKLSITEDMIKIVPKKSSEAEDYKDTVVIDTGISLLGKTPTISLDGYYKVGKPHIKVISETKVQVTIDKRYAAEMALRRGNTQLPWIQPSTVNRTSLKLSTFDTVAYLTQDNSFLIVLNTDELNVNVEALSPTAIDSCYRHYRVPTGIIQDEQGRLLSYTVDGFNQDVVALSVNGDNERKRFVTDYSESDGLTLARAIEVSSVKERKQAFVKDMYIF